MHLKERLEWNWVAKNTEALGGGVLEKAVVGGGTAPSK